MVERTNYGDADVESQSLWIALSVRSFQLHKQLPGLLVITKNVRHSIMQCPRDFHTQIAASRNSEALPPGSSADKGKRLLMRHLLPDDVQLHSSLLLKSDFLLGRQCQLCSIFCLGARSIQRRH